MGNFASAFFMIGFFASFLGAVLLFNALLFSPAMLTSALITAAAGMVLIVAAVLLSGYEVGEK